MMYASAMLFGLTPEQVTELTGYDGQECPFKDGGQRSHHPQELIDMAYKLGYALIPIERGPLISNGIEHLPIFDEIDADNRFGSYLKGNMGLLECYRNGEHHYVAWDGYNIYDPAGYTTVITDKRYLWTQFLLAKALLE
jgi:hypothetical protein